MKVGFLSDIHGNAIALKSCLEHLKKMELDRVYFLGDAVGYMTGEKEVLDLLLKEEISCQLGNHERMMLHPTPQSLEREPIYHLLAARSRLGERVTELIDDWPESRELKIEGKRILMVHGSPFSSIEEYVYPDADLSRFSEIPYDVVFMGHTHRPFIRWINGKMCVNIGSVGLPREHGNLASFAVYDGDQGECQIYRVPFDIHEVISAYNHQLDPSVIACLHRTSPEVVGEILR